MQKLMPLWCVITLFLSVQGSFLDQNNVVIISVPIADCLGSHSSEIDPTLDASALYRNLAFSPEAGKYSCPRVHQCLYNEMGLVRDTKGDELLIEFPHFLCIGADGKNYSRFWIHKNSVYEYHSTHVSQEVQFKDLIPEPYTPGSYSNEAILTLIEPWQDPRTDKWYSVGTRYKRFPERDTDTTYAAILIDYQSLEAHIVHIPLAHALIETPQPLKETKKLFISLIRRWIRHKEGVIPYVWGGCSYINRCTQDQFTCHDDKKGTKSWQRSELSTHETQSGFDCSGLILRAAQMAGIHYFCKNTSTIDRLLKEVDGDLEEGDLILYKGHVCIVSDLQQHTLIDSYGYSKGYGCLREVSLNEAFDKVETYDDLIKMHKTKAPLALKNNEGIVLTTVPSVRLMRLADLQT